MEKAIAALGTAADYILKEWLPGSGCSPAPLPSLEFYLSPPQASTVEIDFYLPVVAK
jgi:predicted transcriptional regulator YdeE